MNKREYSLSILKFMCAICIVFHHYQLDTSTYFDDFINFGGGRFYFGYLVEMFFLISGYFAFRYIEKINDESGFFDFIIPKIIRLIPMLAISVIAYAVITKVQYGIYNLEWNFSLGVIAASALGLYSGILSDKLPVNSPTWYVGVLLLMYVFLFVIVYWGKRLKISPKILFVIMILLGIYIKFAGLGLCVFNTLSARGFYAFFTGVLLHDFIDEQSKKKSSIPIAILILAIFMVLILKTKFLDTSINYWLTFIGFPAVIILIKHDAFKSVFDHSVLDLFGNISYDIYLFHECVLSLIFCIDGHFLLFLNYHRKLTMLFFAVLCIIFGILIYYFIDKPITKYITKKYNARKDR